MQLKLLLLHRHLHWHLHWPMHLPAALPIHLLTPSLLHVAGKRTRIFSSPYGSEVTGSNWYVYDGWAYILVVIQHPYGETDLDKLSQPGNTGVGAYIGYLGPFKNSELVDAIDIDFEEIAVARNDDRHKVRRWRCGHQTGQCSAAVCVV